MREALQQIAATIYTAILEALGDDRALQRADRVLREMLEDADSSIDNPLAIEVLRDMIDGAEHTRMCEHQERLAIEWEQDRGQDRAAKVPTIGRQLRLIAAPVGLFDDLALADRH